MQLERFSGTGGVTVSGVDVRELDDAAIDRIRAAVVDNVVAVLPGQRLTPAEQVAFTRRFGELGEVPFIEPLADHPEVIAVVKESADGDAPNFGGVWHSDFSFQVAPPSFTFLQAVTVPTVGGDTVWANMMLAYRHLDDREKRVIAGLSAVHSAVGSYSPDRRGLFERISGMTVDPSADDSDQAVHPLVTRHPESGAEVLFFNRGYVAGIDGWSAADAGPLLSRLHHHSTHVRFSIRHRWSPGDLVIWDNRSSQHFAMNDYAGQPRRMHRTTCAGSTPDAAG